MSCDGIGNGDGAADVFMRQVMDAASQFERGLIRARTRAAMHEMRKAGERTGTIPFGWSLAADGRLAQVAEEQEVIARIESVTVEDALRVSQAWFAPDRQTVLSLGPQL